MSQGRWGRAGRRDRVSPGLGLAKLWLVFALGHPPAARVFAYSFDFHLNPNSRVPAWRECLGQSWPTETCRVEDSGQAC